jgi:hypothetical protein
MAQIIISKGETIGNTQIPAGAPYVMYNEKPYMRPEDVISREADKIRARHLDQAEQEIRAMAATYDQFATMKYNFEHTGDVNKTVQMLKQERRDRYLPPAHGGGTTYSS